jgi:NADH-quinone oxidoreductase subunit F
VFIVGDAATGPATVVEAISMGHQVAKEVDELIRQKNNEPAYKAPEDEKIVIPFEVDEEVVQTPKAAMPELAVSKRKGNFAEVEKGYTKDAAFKEACRCLRCDAEI